MKQHRYRENQTSDLKTRLLPAVYSNDLFHQTVETGLCPFYRFGISAEHRLFVFQSSYGDFVLGIARPVRIQSAQRAEQLIPNSRSIIALAP